MSSILVRRPYTDLGWRWMRVAGSRAAHLVPAHIGPLSRSACTRLAVYEATLETPAGLLVELERCHACELADS